MIPTWINMSELIHNPDSNDKYIHGYIIKTVLPGFPSVNGNICPVEEYHSSIGDLLKITKFCTYPTTKYDSLPSTFSSSLTRPDWLVKIFVDGVQDIDLFRVPDYAAFAKSFIGKYKVNPSILKYLYFPVLVDKSIVQMLEIEPMSIGMRWIGSIHRLEEGSMFCSTILNAKIWGMDLIQSRFLMSKYFLDMKVPNKYLDAMVSNMIDYIDIAIDDNMSKHIDIRQAIINANYNWYVAFNTILAEISKRRDNDNVEVVYESNDF